MRPWIQFPVLQNSIFNFKELQDYPDIYFLIVEWKKEIKREDMIAPRHGGGESLL